MIELKTIKDVIHPPNQYGRAVEIFIEDQKRGEEMKQTSLVTPEIKRYVWNNREKPAQDLATKIDAEFGVSLKSEDIITIKKARPIDFVPDEEEDDPSEGIIEEEMAGDEE